MTGPQSSGPSSEIVTGNGIVKASATATSSRLARNLPSTRCSRLTGLVNRFSIVPARRSSDHVRIVRVAARKMSSTGNHLNNGRASAMFLAKNVSIQKNRKSIITRKAPRNSNAAGEAKNSVNSLRVIRATTDILRFLLTIGFIDGRKNTFQGPSFGLQKIQF